MMASFAALNSQESTDEDSTDEEENEEAVLAAEETVQQQQVPSMGHVMDMGAASMMGTATSEAQGEEEEDDDDEESSDDEGLPLATPYPWPQDDYELTLHHEPKRRKRVGTGMIYAKRLLQDDDSPYEEATVLSAPAKAILKQLLQQHTKKPRLADDDESSEDEESEDEEDDDDDDEEDDEHAKKSRRRLPGPRLWTSSAESTQGCGLFYNMLEAVDKEHPLHVPTRTVIRTCALKLPPGAPPGSFDAKEFVCCALHWLSSEWESPDPTQLPSLPLIRSTTAPGNARDLEKRTYEKASNWNLDELPLGELERLFLDSPSSAAQLQWMSRVRFCPRSTAGGGMSESTILLKGTIPARMTGKKTTTSPAPKKRKSTASDPAPTQGIVMRANQGKQFPFHPFGGGEEISL